MKRHIFFYIILSSFFSVASIAQKTFRVSSNSISGELFEIDYSAVVEEGKDVLYYHVVEKVAGNVTTYNVSSLDLVRSYALGPNNSRVITPKYAKTKVKKTAMNARIKYPETVKVVAQKNGQVVSTFEKDIPEIPVKEKPVKPIPEVLKTKKQSKAELLNNNATPLSMTTPEQNVVDQKEVSPTETPIPPVPPVPERDTFVMVDVLSTYERILEKGVYKTDKAQEMLIKVANSRFMKQDYAIAVKWYAQLISLNKEVDAEYYNRYAQSLSSIGQVEKSEKMNKIYLEKKVLKLKPAQASK